MGTWDRAVAGRAWQGLTPEGDTEMIPERGTWVIQEGGARVRPEGGTCVAVGARARGGAMSVFLGWGSG